ncbi:polymorphic toxin type 15 domain-containing protein [Acetobacter thailandicus]|uniref:polymorphic toxin type 15 domain-containing protein n=1 Tax=Acetobacter thailandicus TaxID=1502842 RepID=UPI001BA86176|nr:polymorphic toxin type 15 domain-containing protein [Acetobacter thailandicus]MBS1002918.1 hypothetical protein [Acetobacter thailandicus]
MSGAIYGAETGAEIGSVGGPLGAAAGAVAGGLIGLAATYLISSALEHMNQEADTSLTDKEAAEPCYDCGDGPDCFRPPEDADQETVEEFRRQLKGQENGINKMSPDEIIDNIDRYSDLGRDGANPGEQNMREQYRKKYWLKNFRKSLDKYDDEDAAKKYADDMSKGKAALHNPDMRAGGNPMPTDMGSSRVNSSLGSQWSKKGPSSKLKRWEQLKKAAHKAKGAGKKLMNIDLREC